MDAAGAAALEQTLGKAQRDHSGLLGRASYRHVLQEHSGAGSGLAREFQECVDIASLESVPALEHEVVLAPIVQGAQHRAVAQLAAQAYDLAVEGSRINLT